jgi:hypothetical protein
MPPKKCFLLTTLATALALCCPSPSRADDPPPTDSKTQCWTDYNVHISYDVMLGTPFVWIFPNKDQNNPSKLVMGVTCYALNPLVDKLTRAFLATSPALRAPVEEDASEEQELPHRDPARRTNPERRLPLPSEDEPPVYEQEELPLPRPLSPYRDMLRSTQPLEMVPIRPLRDEVKLKPVFLDPDREGDYADIIVDTKKYQANSLIFGAGINGDPAIGNPVSAAKDNIVNLYINPPARNLTLQIEDHNQ